jgi:hypothetical protein
MSDDELVELRCKFCDGLLRLEKPREVKRPVPFRFYRCSVCGMPNVLLEENHAARTREK